MPDSEGVPRNRTCVFCAARSVLTREHVFGDWLTRIGLDLDPVAHAAGPLNRTARDLGVVRPFHNRVREVCGQCNGGWMSRLEAAARRVLTPFIRGQPGYMEPADQGAIAAWVQKTALVAMLLSSDEDRARGYGLPSSEYRKLYERRDAEGPLPATEVWIGRYEGKGRIGSIWVVPQIVAIEGEREPDTPQGYAMTIVLGELLLHGIRFTAPELHVDLSTERGLPRLWPRDARISWPQGMPVDDASFLGLSVGKEFRVAEPHVVIRRWDRATDLPDSHSVGSMVELPTICGEHVVYYPEALVEEALRGRSYTFMTSCDCEKAYLIQTEADGAHCKAVGTPAAVGELYDALPGDEFILEDENGRFVCKATDGPL